MSSSLLRSSSLDQRYYCLCGLCHVVKATQMCLALYVAASIFSIIFGSKDLLTWLLVPFFVVSLSIYAFITERHKYLYPFLIITIVQQFVSLIMAFIVISFASLNFDALRKIIAHSLQMDHLPSISLSLSLIMLTITLCIFTTIFHIWQALIIYRCLEYYEDRIGSIDGSTFARYRDDIETTIDWTTERDCRTGNV